MTPSPCIAHIFYIHKRHKFLFQGVTKKIGRGMYELAAKVDEYARGMLGPPGATLFEELGLYYIGPVNGHSIDDLICVLQEVASLDSMGPVLIHVITEENQGVEDCQKKELAHEQSEGMFLTHFLLNGIPSLKRDISFEGVKELSSASIL